MMDEKTLVKALAGKAAEIEGVEVFVDWPFEKDADRAFYVETGEGENWQRFTIHIHEIARFQIGNVYF